MQDIGLVRQQIQFFLGGVGVIFSYTQRSLLLAVEHCRETTVLITPSPLNCSEAREKNPLTH